MYGTLHARYVRYTYGASGTRTVDAVHTRYTRCMCGPHGACALHTVHARCIRYMYGTYGARTVHTVHVRYMRYTYGAYGICAVHTVHVWYIWYMCPGCDTCETYIRDAKHEKPTWYMCQCTGACTCSVCTYMYRMYTCLTLVVANPDVAEVFCRLRTPCRRGFLHTVCWGYKGNASRIRRAKRAEGKPGCFIGNRKEVLMQSGARNAGAPPASFAGLRILDGGGRQMDSGWGG